MLMFKPFRAVAFLVFALVFAVSLTVTPDARSEQGLAGGARYRKDHSDFKDMPFDDGDMSYFLLYVLSNERAAWEIGLDYASDVSGLYGATAEDKTTDTDESTDAETDEPAGKKVDYVLTPQLNLVFKDRMFRAGAGMLASYIKQEDGDTDWTSLYWQLELGLEFRVANRFVIGAGTYYLVESWGDITDFSFDELEYGGRLCYMF